MFPFLFLLELDMLLYHQLILGYYALSKAFFIPCCSKMLYKTDFLHCGKLVLQSEYIYFTQLFFVLFLALIADSRKVTGSK